MVKNTYEPCLPTPGKQVPSSDDGIHEIKHDGYCLIVQREGKRVRLFTRNGHDWTSRYPLIVEAALKNRTASFVVDGEAVLLGVDGVSDFNGLHSRKYDDEVQLYAFDILSLEGTICDRCRCTCARTTSPATCAPAGGNPRQQLRARRDRPRPVPRGLQLRTQGHGQ